jgi:hypothetical protein
VGGVGLGEDGADSGRDHLGVAFGDLGQNVAQEGTLRRFPPIGGLTPGPIRPGRAVSAAADLTIAEGDVSGVGIIVPSSHLAVPLHGISEHDHGQAHPKCT